MASFIDRLGISKLKVNRPPNISAIFFGCSGFQTAKGSFGYQEHITQK